MANFPIITYYRPPCIPGQINGHLCLTSGQMGAGHILELGDAVLDPASGSAQVGGPCMLNQRDEGLLAAEALARLVPAVTHPRRVRDCRDSST